MTVCINGTCPFEECSHHPGQLKGMPRDDTVTVMSLDAMARTARDGRLTLEAGNEMGRNGGGSGK